MQKEVSALEMKLHAQRSLLEHIPGEKHELCAPPEAAPPPLVICSLCQAPAVDHLVAAHLAAVTNDLEQLTQDRDELRKLNMTLEQQLAELHRRLIALAAEMNARREAAVSEVRMRMQTSLDSAIAERDGARKELELQAAAYGKLQVEYAALRNQTTRNLAEATAALQQEVALAEQDTRREAGDAREAEKVAARANDEKELSEGKNRQLVHQVARLEAALAAKQKEYDEVPKLGEVVAAVLQSAAETTHVVQEEGARISNELPRIRAVKLVQAQRDALASATAAAAEWSEVQENALRMKLELSRYELEHAHRLDDLPRALSAERAMAASQAELSARSSGSKVLGSENEEGTRDRTDKGRGIQSAQAVEPQTALSGITTVGGMAVDAMGVAAEALSRGAVVFPARSNVGMAALDVALQAELRKGMGPKNYKQYKEALTAATPPHMPTAAAWHPNPPTSARAKIWPGSGSGSGSAGISQDWWSSMPGSLEPWQAQKAVAAVSAAGIKPAWGESTCASRPGAKVENVSSWLATYGTPRRA